MNTRQAKILGRRGGLARAKSLSAKRRKQIAALGGKSKALSTKAAQRIQDNFIYLDIIQQLQKPPRAKSVSQVRGSLPGIYAKNRS